MKKQRWESVFLNKYICLSDSEIHFCGSFVSKETCHECIHSFVYNMPLRKKIKIYLKLSLLDFKRKLRLLSINLPLIFRSKNKYPF